VFLLIYTLEGMLTINGKIRMNYKLYIIALAFCLIASCKQQKNEEPIQDSMSIISKATEEAGGLENWTKLNEVKFGLNKISFEEGASTEINEIHVYERGERPKKRISFENESGDFITYAEIMGQYFSFENDTEDTLVNKEMVEIAVLDAYQMTCLPFNIIDLEGQMKYLGSDSTTHSEISEVVAISEDNQKWWFYFSKKSGAILSYKHLRYGVTTQTVIEVRQEFEGFQLPVYVKKYKLDGARKVLLENIYLGTRTFK